MRMIVLLVVPAAAAAATTAAAAAAAPVLADGGEIQSAVADLGEGGREGGRGQ